ARYLNYAAVLVSGKTLTGMLAEETSTSITLVEQQDKRHVILRADVEQLQSTGKSLMPDGLEKDLSLQDMSDLITYVLASGPPPKTIEGNQPQVVVADEQG